MSVPPVGAPDHGAPSALPPPGPVEPRSNLRDKADPAAIRARHRALFDAPLVRRLRPVAIVAILVGLTVLAVWRLDVSFARLGSGLVQIATILGQMFPPTPGSHLAVFLHALGETLAIALLGTLVGAVIAFPLGLLAAKNVIPNVFAHFTVRRGLDTIRGVDVLIWALIFINVVGLGPFAGILAIAASDIGSFGKLFSEAIENADRKPVEGVLSTGGSQLHAVRYGLVPQVIPVIASQVLYYFESNTRSATIIGIVGAGGIGLHLAEQIRVLEWGKVAFLVLMILVTVAIIDFASGKLRFAIIGRSAIAVD
ncbi:Phosphate-import permease protein PhnE [Rhodoplanes serenus]|uniref:Phosphate-import permease protein PhnE n=1 Tax=Rhodoplanes serenus TaxID=200615 RepID=A0A447CZ39_9BRAD|nr:phosphonate ABC transporter, permease protein PhnE [Rhodoplanes serenus]VCU10485.1 Phosphate-import permease protein PhnE [Rhodoplanes serenus]